MVASRGRRPSARGVEPEVHPLTAWPTSRCSRRSIAATTCTGSRTWPSSFRATWRSTAPTSGLDAYAAEMQAVSHARSLTMGGRLRRLVVDPPCIAAHFTDTGTHRRAFLGDRSLGRRPEFAVCRVDAGQIADVWGSAFHVHLLEQLRKPMSKPPPDDPTATDENDQPRTKASRSLRAVGVLLRRIWRSLCGRSVVVERARLTVYGTAALSYDDH